jgi:hypothetical protein
MSQGIAGFLLARTSSGLCPNCFNLDFIIEFYGDLKLMGYLDSYLAKLKTEKTEK